MRNLRGWLSLVAPKVLAVLALYLAAPGAEAVGAHQLGLVYNAEDETSREVARYYAAARGIPSGNLFGVFLGTSQATLSADAFAKIYDDLQLHIPKHVEVYALAWTRPFRVECMSITSAFAFGFDDAYCASPCEPTRSSPYYDSSTRRPYSDHGIRPAAMLAGRTIQNVKHMIDRGVRSDYTAPASSAYLVVTPDRARSTRAPRYADAKRLFEGRYRVNVLQTEGVRHAFDIMFYFTGARHVPFIETLGFLPGALADHLTSSGGVLTGKSQMSILDWIEAGATGSYGTVVEPCNFPQKFPDPPVAMMHYLDGETLIEAYWKSVRWPGQGVFVGEPLARPFARRTDN